MDGITYAAPCLSLAIESEAEGRCYSWITMCCAAWSSEYNKLGCFPFALEMLAAGTGTSQP